MHGQDLINNTIPTFVVTTSDAVSVGLIKSPDDHHKFARVTTDPNRYYRQVDIFYKLTRFKKLGVIYENSVTGISYAGIEQIKKLQQKNRFTIVECFSLDDNINEQDKKETSVIQCLSDLTGKIDALYVTQQSGVNEKVVSKIVEWANQNKIKTFSQSGSSEVNLGLLMGTAPNKFNIVGQFEAEGIAAVLNGTPINTLSQILVDPIFISINLITAKKIDYSPPPSLMGVVEEIIR